MNEADFQRRITDTCDLMGLIWHHETDSRRSNAGFPDLVIAGPGGVLFAELKSEKGRITSHQNFWLYRLREAGSMAVIWRPSHWDEFVLPTLRGLSRRK